MYDQKDNVAAMHPLYWESQKKREIYQDVCEGTVRLRARRHQYLPQFPAESDADYEYRAETATCFNLTKKTRDVMTGLVFKDSTIFADDVDPEILELWENIDNAGNHGDVFSREAFEAAFEGYAVISVDSPRVSVRSREEQMILGLRPYWILHRADDVLNWRYEVNPVSKQTELRLIVLRQITEEPAGDFVSEAVIRYRVFRFDGMTVSFEMYREIVNRDNRVEYVLEDTGVLPELSQIPVAVIGTLGGDPLLMDIALKNIEHFQTYSDYKSLIHKTCVPIPVAKGLEMMGSETVSVNGSTLMQTSSEGGFDFAEVGGSSLQVVRQTLQDNRDEAALMGLSILSGRADVEMTATEVLLNSISETAELRVFARNFQDALELALGHTAEYLRKDRSAGGSARLGTAWAEQQAQFKVSLEELDKRADIANKLDGLMSREWIIKFLGVDSEEEMELILDQIRNEDVVIVEDRIEEERPMEGNDDAAEEGEVEEDDLEEYQDISA